EFMTTHKAILSLGHDETWTYAERKGAQAAVDHGVNLAFLSAAAMVRHARLQPSPIGAARQEINYRDSAADPLNGKGDPNQVTGNTWDSPPASRSTLPLIGQAYMGYLNPGAPPADFVVDDASAWIFKGTGLHNGAVLPGIIGSDFDHLMAKGSPANLQVLGHSPIPMSRGFTGGPTWNGNSYSDMTYYTRADSQAGVFDSGMVSWIANLTPCATGTSCPAEQVQHMTANLL
ncbi:MAG: N,N-dimethylformamidase beta subunit family domain-containing protein, partial [Dermatophilaceae bacterium]